jgi:hypothetical protein
MSRFQKGRQVQQRYAGRTGFYQHIRNHPSFPKPLNIRGIGKCWDSRQLDEFDDLLIAEAIALAQEGELAPSSSRNTEASGSANFCVVPHHE